MNHNLNPLSLDIGSQLLNDPSGAHKRQLTQQLSEHLLKVQQTLNMGVSSTHFEGLNQLKKAIEASISLLKSIEL